MPPADTVADTDRARVASSADRASIDPAAVTLETHLFDADDDRAAAFRRDQLGAVAAFLNAHLGRYGDPEAQIRRCLRYATAADPAPGGSVTLARAGSGRIVGAVVTNRTGMGGYIPGSILVYIAVHDEARGQGLGGRLLDAALAALPGDVALHVEPDNPARRLYERHGFRHVYDEMRLRR